MVWWAYTNRNGASMSTTTAPATAKQVNFANVLIDAVDALVWQVGTPEDQEAWTQQVRPFHLDEVKAGRKNASAAIDRLIALRDHYRGLAREQASAAAPAKAEVPEGMHYVQGTVWKVQRSQHGRLYAKELVDGTFEYRGARPLASLSDATMMTLEDAQEFGKLYGVCCRCGATLTDEDSIAAGIGPICATYF